MGKDSTLEKALYKGLIDGAGKRKCLYMVLSYSP